MQPHSGSELQSMLLKESSTTTVLHEVLFTVTDSMLLNSGERLLRSFRALQTYSFRRERAAQRGKVRTNMLMEHKITAKTAYVGCRAITRR